MENSQVCKLLAQKIRSGIEAKNKEGDDGR